VVPNQRRRITPGPVLLDTATRILGEFGDDPHRFVDAKAR
jgi:hypothetical protein